VLGLVTLGGQGVGGQELGPALLAIGPLREGGAAVGGVEQDLGERAPVGV